MKYYKPQKLEKTIKKVIDKQYVADGMYVVLVSVHYDYDIGFIEIKARYGRAENTDGFHTFERDIKFMISGKERYIYIEGIVDGIIQESELEIGSN